jgi:hypothetical protein
LLSHPGGHFLELESLGAGAGHAHTVFLTCAASSSSSEQLLGYSLRLRYLDCHGEAVLVERSGSIPVGCAFTFAQRTRNAQGELLSAIAQGQRFLHEFSLKNAAPCALNLKEVRFLLQIKLFFELQLWNIFLFEILKGSC